MMFGFGPATRIYVATGDPESGHVFLFTNARRNRLKLLVYDHSGTMDMLEKIGRRKVSLAGSRHVVTQIILSHEELALLLGGLIWLRRGGGNGIASRSRKNPRSYRYQHKYWRSAHLSTASPVYQRSIVSAIPPAAGMPATGTGPCFPAELLEQLKEQLPEALFATLRGTVATPSSMGALTHRSKQPANVTVVKIDQ
jgi:transposase